VHAVRVVLLRQSGKLGERRPAIRSGDTLKGRLSLREDVPISLEVGQALNPSTPRPREGLSLAAGRSTMA
jgi:hypothetical protein